LLQLGNTSTSGTGTTAPLYTTPLFNWPINTSSGPVSYFHQSLEYAGSLDSLLITGRWSTAAQTQTVYHLGLFTLDVSTRTTKLLTSTLPPYTDYCMDSHWYDPERNQYQCFFERKLTSIDLETGNWTKEVPVEGEGASRAHTFWVECVQRDPHNGRVVGINISNISPSSPARYHFNFVELIQGSLGGPVLRPISPTWESASFYCATNTGEQHPAFSPGLGWHVIKQLPSPTGSLTHYYFGCNYEQGCPESGQYIDAQFGGAFTIASVDEA